MSNKRNDSKLKDHKQEGKILNPPFLAGGMNFKESSWINDRLPEMIWTLLIISNIERTKALDFFRYVAKYVQDNNDCLDITMTGISKIPDEKRKDFIRYITSYSAEVNNALRVILFFQDLPAYEDWKAILPDSISDDDWNTLAESVGKVYWHQSQEATDCRWIRILCMILGGKISFTQKTEVTLKGILEYPNNGDMREVRPMIRAMEIGPMSQDVDLTWAKNFWNKCFSTQCIPEEAVSKKIKDRQEKLGEEIENSREYYNKQTNKLRHKLIDHFFENLKPCAVDSRLDSVFGLTFYGLALFMEIIFYSTSSSITGRLSLRALAEVQITLSYLLQKEKTEPRVWDDFRIYGTGQTKLIVAKLEERSLNASSIEIDEMDMIANEDKWVEFIPINLGHWDSVNLRKMSDEVGLKDLYDKYYNYTSGFMHGNWGAIRESIFQRCVNPLHRFHRIPTYDLPLMPSVLDDALEIVNDILKLLNKAYPDFNEVTEKFAEKSKPNQK